MLFYLGTTNLTNYTNLAWVAHSFFLTAKEAKRRERKTWVVAWVDSSFITTEDTEYTEGLGLIIRV
jgi:hypothetical protein